MCYAVAFGRAVVPVEFLLGVDDYGRMAGVVGADGQALMHCYDRAASSL
jgi:hypothetical protein